MKKTGTNFKIRNSIDLNKILSKTLIDLKKGRIDINVAKNISTIADKINRNNINALSYKKITKHKKDIRFFEESE